MSLSLSSYVCSKIDEYLADVDEEVRKAIYRMFCYLKRLQIVEDGEILCLTERLLKRFKPTRNSYLVVMDPWTEDAAATITGADLFMKIKSCTETDGSDLPRVASFALRLSGFMGDHHG